MSVLALAAACLSAFAASPEPLSVAVAANMLPAMEELAAEFRAETGAELALTPGSSGKFATQIRNGAPFDVFVSADMEFPEAVAKAGLSDGPAVRYARGSLVVWTLRGADVSSLKKLARLKTIAVADPRLAPYGRAAIEVLKKAGLYEALEKRLVYGESLAQVNQFVASKAVDAGFVSRSIVETPAWKGKGTWSPVDPALHAPIDQGLVVTRRGAERNPRLSRRLKKLLLGPKGRRILERYGYTIPRA